MGWPECDLLQETRNCFSILRSHLFYERHYQLRWSMHFHLNNTAKESTIGHLRILLWSCIIITITGPRDVTMLYVRSCLNIVIFWLPCLKNHAYCCTWNFGNKMSHSHVRCVVNFNGFLAIFYYKISLCSITYYQILHNQRLKTIVFYGSSEILEWTFVLIWPVKPQGLTGGREKKILCLQVVSWPGNGVPSVNSSGQYFIMILWVTSYLLRSSYCDFSGMLLYYDLILNVM